MNLKVQIALIGALAGAVSGAITAILGGHYDILGIQEERITQLEIRNKELQSNLILKAIDTEDPKKSIQTLEFFADVKLIPDYEEGVYAFLSQDDAEQKVPALRSQLPAYRSSDQLSTLDTVRYRTAMQATGLLVANLAYCTAWLYGHDLVVTAEFCVKDEKLSDLWELRLGYLSSTQPGTSYAIKEIVKIDETYQVAVLRLEKPVPTTVARMDAEGREPVSGEGLFMVHYPAGEPLRISDEQCRATSVQGDDIEFLHYQCRTEGGSSGSVIFSSRDARPLGMHISATRGDSGEKRAILWHHIMDVLSNIE